MVFTLTWLIFYLTPKITRLKLCSASTTSTKQYYGTYLEFFSFCGSKLSSARGATFKYNPRDDVHQDICKHSKTIPVLTKNVSTIQFTKYQTTFYRYLMESKAVRSSLTSVRSDANVMCEFSIEAQPI